MILLARPFILPLLVTALERHGHLMLDVTVRARVLAASAATIDRMLRSTRASVSGQRVRRRAVPVVQKNVPVRTFAEWEDPLPGDMEADLVSTPASADSSGAIQGTQSSASGGKKDRQRQPLQF